MVTEIQLYYSDCAKQVKKMYLILSFHEPPSKGRKGHCLLPTPTHTTPLMEK